MNSSKIVLYTNLIALSKERLTTNKSSLDLDLNKLFSRHNNVMTVHVDIQYKNGKQKSRKWVTKQNKAYSGENLSTLKHFYKLEKTPFF